MSTPVLTTRDVRVNGYPPLHLVLAHYDALPVLIEAVRTHAPEVLEKWDLLRKLERKAVPLVPVSREGEQVLNPEVRV